MKLYLYDHCPFCVRVMMGFRLKGLPVEEVFLPYDDEETPRRMTGRKMLPILEDAGGFMGESLDILHRIDRLSPPRLFGQEPRPEIADWIAVRKPVIWALVLPRVVDPAFPEFRTASARGAFVAAKEKSYGSFADLLARTGPLIDEMAEGLDQLAPLLPGAGQVGIDDILLFPMIRALRVVPGLPVNAALRAYSDRITRLTGLSGLPPG